MPTTVRLDADVLAYFKAGGPGYQTRINAELRKVANRGLVASLSAQRLAKLARSVPRPTLVPRRRSTPA